MVENYSSDYDVKCELDACKTYPITDSERGEIVCGDAGLILVQNMKMHHIKTTVTLKKIYAVKKNRSCNIINNA